MVVDADTPARPAVGPPDLAALALAEQLETAWRAALFAKDDETLDALMDEGFRLIGVRGTGPLRVDRAQWLAALARMDLVQIDTSIETAVRHGDNLIVTALCDWQVRYLGQTIEEKVLVSDCWRRQGDGSWRVVHRHSSLLPATMARD